MTDFPIIHCTIGSSRQEVVIEGLPFPTKSHSTPATTRLMNMMRVVDAVLVTTLAATFCAGGMVGMGRGVGVVGGGAMHALPSSFIRVPSWQTHS